MESPIGEFIYSTTGIDPFLIICVLALLIIILMILNIVSLTKIGNLRKKLERFTEGKDGETLEEEIFNSLEKTLELDESNKDTRAELVKLRRVQRYSYQKMGIVRYNAFNDLSGNLSYAVCLLNQRNDGMVINSVYSREGSYSYIKTVKGGIADVPLSPAEQRAMDQAIDKGPSDDETLEN